MYEVEVKVEAAHGPVRERLVELGAESLGSVRQRDTYYDHPARSFAETDEALRLRVESGGVDATVDWRGGESATEGGEEPSPATATLTYKGPLVDDVSKTRREVETRVDDPVAADALLRAVGFEAAAEVVKERERFACGGYVVALDAVRGLGEYVEVEARGEDDEVDRLQDGAFDLCRRLGLEPADSTSSSYLALLFESVG